MSRLDLFVNHISNVAGDCLLVANGQLLEESIATDKNYLKGCFPQEAQLQKLLALPLVDQDQAKQIAIALRGKVDAKLFVVLVVLNFQRFFVGLVM